MRWRRGSGVRTRAGRWAGLLALALTAAVLGVPAAAAATSAPTVLISAAAGGGQGNAASAEPAVDGTGRFVAFTSAASDLVPGDTNRRQDVFVRDSETGRTTRVSVSSAGQQANGDSFDASISADGRFVVFDSFANNLVLPDTNGRGDVFLRDLETGRTTLVSAGADGGTANGDSGFAEISADGSHVAFESAATDLMPSGGAERVSDIYVWNRAGGEVTRASVPTGGARAGAGSGEPSISADGRYVAFTSAANLAPGDGNGKRDIYVRDRVLRTTTRASVSSLGTEANGHSATPSISADGRYVGFTSQATDLLVALPGGAGPGETSSLDAVLFGGDAEFVDDVFVHDLRTRTTERVSVGPDGAGGNRESFGPSLSADGRYVAFASFADNLAPGGGNSAPEVFIHDRRTGTTRLASVGAGGAGNRTSSAPAISDDGRAVVFTSDATNLVAGLAHLPAYVDSLDTDVYLHRPDLAAPAAAGGEATRPAGVQVPTAVSGAARPEAAGRPAAPAAPGDPAAADTVRVNVGAQGRQATKGHSYSPAISANGRYVAFDSEDDTLVPGDTNGISDVFVRDTQTGRTTRVSVGSAGRQATQKQRCPPRHRVCTPGSFAPSISGDGRYVVFTSTADNLVAGDTNGGDDVFLHDRQTGRTTRVSLARDGRELSGAGGGVISRDGRSIVYTAGTPLVANGTVEDLDGMFVHDHVTGERQRLGDLGGYDPSVSADGRYVAFSSGVRDLVKGDTNRKEDSFVHDRRTGRTVRASVASDGRQGSEDSVGAVISANGRYVTFDSGATDLVGGDTNTAVDVFLHDLKSRQTDRISVTGQGGQADGTSGAAAPSADGRHVVFLSQAPNLVPGDRPDPFFGVFVRDGRTGKVQQVNLAPGGRPANGDSTSFPVISADGRFVAFGSAASNLVAADTNDRNDIFVRPVGR